ncbi:MAG: TRAP transporter small permease subunit [Desulfobacteraceae bacterium]|nr:MAG: TRAP transporter small permease subunit [Desulfobacteraceae bacterium]
MGDKMAAENRQSEKPEACLFVDKLIDRIGRYFSWLNIVLILVIMSQVILRYAFGLGSVILEELQFHLYGVMLIVAVSYTLVHDGHIRLDLFYTRFSRSTKEKVEIFGIVCLLLPMAVILFLHSLDFFQASWSLGERSDAPMGLCCRWALKAFIPVGMLLLWLAAASRLLCSFSFLKKDSRRKE